MGTIVRGEGPVDAEIMLVGQNPGSEEARQGRPFVGRSGKYLDTVLRKNGIDRSRIYITSVVKETTPQNRKPTREETDYWMPRLLEEIKLIRPKVIVLMGNTACETPRLKNIVYIETCHPAAAMRFPKMRERFETDFKKLAEYFIRPSAPEIP